MLVKLISDLYIAKVMHIGAQFVPLLIIWTQWKLRI